MSPHETQAPAVAVAEEPRPEPEPILLAVFPRPAGVHNNEQRVFVRHYRGRPEVAIEQWRERPHDGSMYPAGSVYFRIDELSCLADVLDNARRRIQTANWTR